MEELTKQILEGQGRYEDLRRDMEKVFEKYGLRPLEIYRLANELQARSFEMFINAMDNFIEERMNGVKK